MRVVAVAAVVVLYILHQDFWFWREARPLVFGFLPIGLFYHAIFTLASSAVLWLLVAFAWPSHVEAEPSGAGRGAPASERRLAGRRGPRV